MYEKIYDFSSDTPEPGGKLLRKTGGRNELSVQQLSRLSRLQYGLVGEERYIKELEWETKERGNIFHLLKGDEDKCKIYGNLPTSSMV